MQTAKSHDPFQARHFLFTCKFGGLIGFACSILTIKRLKIVTPPAEKITKFGALRKGPPFHGSRSSREIKIQNASCQTGGREVTR